MNSHTASGSIQYPTNEDDAQLMIQFIQKVWEQKVKELEALNSNEKAMFEIGDRWEIFSEHFRA